MKIGEIVEILIRIKDNYGYSDYRREALEETCNLLDKLPRMEETKDYEPTSLSGQSMAAEQIFSRALDVGNGQLLCNECHKRIHGGENRE